MDYEGKHFPEEEKKLEKERSSKVGWIIKQIFRYTFWGICALVWGIIFYRIFSSTNARLVKQMYFSDDAVVIAQKLGDEFTVYSVQTASTMNEDGTVKVINNLYAEDAKEFEIGLTEPMGMDSAQVTAGGIVTSEFNEKTMESRMVPGLYACGEVLDIDGDCGGYNLHWAWATAKIAGKAVSKC